jgi:hypothetical protein
MQTTTDKDHPRWTDFTTRLLKRRRLLDCLQQKLYNRYCELRDKILLYADMQNEAPRNFAQLRKDLDEIHELLGFASGPGPAPAFTHTEIKNFYDALLLRSKHLAFWIDYTCRGLEQEVRDNHRAASRRQFMQDRWDAMDAAKAVGPG